MRHDIKTYRTTSYLRVRTRLTLHVSFLSPVKNLTDLMTDMYVPDSLYLYPSSRQWRTWLSSWQICTYQTHSPCIVPLASEEPDWPHDRHVRTRLTLFVSFLSPVKNLTELMTDMYAPDSLYLYPSSRQWRTWLNSWQTCTHQTHSICILPLASEEPDWPHDRHVRTRLTLFVSFLSPGRTWLSIWQTCKYQTHSPCILPLASEEPDWAHDRHARTRLTLLVSFLSPVKNLTKLMTDMHVPDSLSLYPSSRQWRT